MKFTATLFFLIISQFLYGQTFSEMIQSPPLTGVKLGSTGIADIDNDGDNDVLITGLSSTSGQIAKLYKNDGDGNFTEVMGTPFIGVFNGSVSFSDVDNDGDSDVLITGGTAAFQRSAILYKNDGAGFFSASSNSPFEGVSSSTSSFSDIDSDGDDDVLIIGSSNSNNRSVKLYINDGSGNFEERSDTSLIGTSQTSLAFSDIDGDGDEDLLITGQDTSFTRSSKLYKNDGVGNFTELTSAMLAGVRNSDVTFKDVDSDGDFDVLVPGQTETGDIIAKLYVNDGAGIFAEDIGSSFEGVTLGAVAFSDIDLDGDLDVLLTGEDNSNQPSAKVYTNDGAGIFTLIPSNFFENVKTSSLAFSDFDNDGDDDLILSGENITEDLITKIYITKDNLLLFFNLPKKTKSTSKYFLTQQTKTK